MVAIKTLEISFSITPSFPGFKIMNFYTVFIFAILAVAAVSGHRCRGGRGGYSGGGRGGGIIIGSKKD